MSSMAREQERLRQGSASFLATKSKVKPKIDIRLDDEQQGSFICSYTTLEKIQGVVSITSPSDLAIDDLLICFQGSSRTYVEKIASTGPGQSRTQANHTFLRLVQPIKATDIPPERTLRAGTTYHFRFTFVVPERLLPQACTHPQENPNVSEAHLFLPPSLGDPMMAGDGKTLMNDLAPENSEISYKLRVVVFRHPKECGSKPEIIVDNAKKIRVIPRVEEQPPISLSENDGYTMKREKSIKKGIFKGKLGVLTVETAQPHSIHLPFIRSNPGSPKPSTMAVVNLRFDAADASAKPPRLGSLWTRLKICTFFASTPQRDFPSKTNAYMYDSSRGIYVETIPLSSRCVTSALWESHRTSGGSGSATPSPPPESEAPVRRDSSFALSSHRSFLRRDSAISFRRGSAPSIPITVLPPTHYYTCQILVPIDLPSTLNKTFVPTFHSCLVSRIYALDLTLSVHSPLPTVSASHIHLKVPLQLSAEGNSEARAMISAEEAAAIAVREADGVFVPRSIAPPLPAYLERSELGRIEQHEGVAPNETESDHMDEEIGMEPPGYTDWGVIRTMGRVQ